jgi:hypothetical protein
VPPGDVLLQLLILDAGAVAGGALTNPLQLLVE